MDKIQTVQPVFAAYRAGDLKEAFKAQIAYHGQQIEKYPMGSDGLHESLKRRAERSLEALNTKDDSDILTFPTLLSDFTRVIAPSGQPSQSFLDYHNSGKIGMLTVSQAYGLGLIRSLS